MYRMKTVNEPRTVKNDDIYHCQLLIPLQGQWLWWTLFFFVFFSTVHPLCYKIRLKIKFCQWGMYIWNINWIELNSPIMHSAWKRLIFNFQTGFKFYFLQGRGGGFKKFSINLLLYGKFKGLHWGPHLLFHCCWRQLFRW